MPQSLKSTSARMDCNKISSRSLAEFYQEDCPGAVMVFQPPTTHIPPLQRSKLFRNREKYTISDYFYKVEPGPDSEMEFEYRSVAKYRFLALLVGEVKVYSTTGYPPEELLCHWAEVFHDGQRRLSIETTDTLDDRSTYIVYFPMENLASGSQAVDPDALYQMQSKKFLECIPCPRARTLDKHAPGEFPCLLKLCQGFGGAGNYVISNPTELRNTVARLQEVMPGADYVLNEYITDVVKNYGNNIYLSKSGEMTWFGAGEQTMSDIGRWQGDIYYHDDQEKIREPMLQVLRPVAQALHDKGYFGYASVDVLIDAGGRHYVVDVNPRFSGAALSVTGGRLMAAKGYKVAIQALRLKFQGPLANILQQIRTVTTGKVVLGAATSGSKTVLCELAIFSYTYEQCLDILQTCKKLCS